MDYNRIYASIVLRAQVEYTQRKYEKKHGKYFESHHIIPKSLGGVNFLYNRALLTAREHFLCHWLLVKIYPVGTDAHNKMLMAFWRMQSQNNQHNRYIFSHAYEKLRIEYATHIGTLTRISQHGERNSHYGTKWYTNYETGESKTFKGKPPSKLWVAGRYLFNGQSSSIRNLVEPIIKKRIKYINTNSVNSKLNRVRIKKQKQEQTPVDLMKYEHSVMYARKLWNQYHMGNYHQLEDFAKVLNISKVALYKWFHKYIPIYNTSKTQIKRAHFSSNPNLIGIYF